MEDRLKFRQPIKCNSCGFIGFQRWIFNGQQFIEDGFDKCKCENPKFEIIGELEQCTGLKDKNGKLIFEHDNVKVYDDFTATVIWNKKYKCLDIASTGNTIGFYGSNQLEVIGTIHDKE